MKKGVFLAVTLIWTLMFGGVNAESDYVNDYTLIDCIQGDDAGGVAFDSSQPYQSLKAGIEKTISYINANAKTQSGAVFNIKVNCFADSVSNETINLDYLGASYNNELYIESLTDSATIEDVKFQLSHDAGNITFDNFNFKVIHFPVFYEYMHTGTQNRIHPNSRGIKILNGKIELFNGNNLGEFKSYKIFSYYWSGRRIYDHYSYYNNKINLENVDINVEIDQDMTFHLPARLKDSKLTFHNTTLTGSYNITLQESGNTSSIFRINSAYLISNDIDFGGNSVLVESDYDIALANNKLTSFSSIDLGDQAVYFNNYIGNTESMDISTYKNLYNNIFESGFTDSYDIMNVRKNYHIDNMGTKGLGWIFKRYIGNKMFEINTTSHKLYEEITGQEIPMSRDGIYVIY